MRKKTGALVGAVIIAAFVMVFGAGPAIADTIKVAGSGGMIALVSELARAYTAKNPGHTIDVLQRSIEAKGGIMGTYNGDLDLGMSARLLNPDETPLGLKSMEIARVATVVAVNAGSVKVQNISSRDVCGIYSGQVTSWKEVGGPDRKIKAFTRTDSDSTKQSVRKGIKCFAGLVEAPSVAVMPKFADMYNALVNNADSIGFADSIAVGNSGGKLRALSLDGVEPNEANLLGGKWPLVKNFVLVSKGEPKGLARDFVEFIKGPEGAKIIRANEAVPVK